MRIEKLTLQNFRLFENREFSFHPQFNLIIGENGSGKSSLLRGFIVALRYFLEDFVFESKEGQLENNDIRENIISENNNDLRVEKEIPIILKMNFEAKFLQNEAEEESFSTENIFWGKQSKNNKFVEKASYTMPYLPDNWPLESKVLAPLVVFYGCNRLWLSKAHKNLHENAMTAKYSRRDGYKDWAKAQADSTQLIEWLLKQNIIAFQEGKESLGWRVLNIALKKCFEEFSHISFMAKEGDLVVHFVGGHRQLFKHMSDGQRCMIGLIGDMVRRAVLLNPQLGDKILEETSGVVLIDELDLHLHPKWQRRIINDLKITFPKVQFICTTHSPQLIGQAKPEEIIILDQETTRHPAQSYGMDSNWILRHVMGGKDRDPVVAAKLDDVFDDIENANFEMAQSKIIELRKEIGEHPELVEAEVLIHRYTHLYEDEE